MSGTILLVDDTVMFLQIQKDFLKMSTLTVVCARNGAEALERVKESRPALVIMDLHMPVMNGAECCAAIKADPALRSIPVIMATSAANEKDLAVCRSAGCDGLLTKPFERSLFMDTVRRFVHGLDRREKRIPFESRVRFQAFRVIMNGTSVDLSSRGIYLATEFRLDVGTEIVLVFPLSDREDELVQAKGSVRWTNGMDERRKEDYPPGFGVELTTVTANSLAMLQRYLAVRCA